NISGLEKRIKYYLNFKQKGITSITNFGLEKYEALTDFILRPESTARKGKDKFRARLSLKELMRHGMDRKNYQIQATEDGFFAARFYRTPSADPQLLFAHEEEIKCKQVVRQLIDWLKEFDENCSGFFLLEHILLRPMTIEGRRLLFDVGPTGVPIKFQSLMYLPGEEMRHISDGLIISASNEDNYVRFQVEDETYLLLKIDGHPMMVSTEPLSNDLLAKRPESVIIDYLNEIKVEGSSQIDEWIELVTQPNYAKELGPDFFNYRISIVVPDWPRKWQLVDFRRYFRILVQSNIPAHLAADIHFLSLGDMKSFEDSYQAWLEEKRREDTAPSELDKHALSIIKHLLKDDETKAKISDFLKAQEVENESINKMRSAVVGSVGFDVLDEGNFSIFVGMDKLIAKELKRNGIDNWAKLQIAQIDYLVNILTLAKSDSLIESINAWQRQAVLAEQRNWTGLIALQIELEALTTDDAQPRLMRFMKENFGSIPTVE
ncbi:MAG: hypothetical protein AAF705_08810, partial [Bacteroidota bacterium]